MIAGSMRSKAIMRSASFSSLAKNCARRSSQARVASERMVGKSPMMAPKLDSRPQNETSTSGCTPYCACTRRSSVAVLRQHLAALGDAILADRVADIAPEGQQEFGLAAIELDDFRVGRRHAGEGALHHVLRNAARDRIGLQVQNAGAEGALVQRRRDRLAAGIDAGAGDGGVGLRMGGAAGKQGQRQQNGKTLHRHDTHLQGIRFPKRTGFTGPRRSCRRCAGSAHRVPLL